MQRADAELRDGPGPPLEEQEVGDPCQEECPSVKEGRGERLNLTEVLPRNLQTDVHMYYSDSTVSVLSFFRNFN